MKIIQIMPVPDGIIIGEMSTKLKDGKPYISAVGIGTSPDDSRCCVLALVEDEGGYQCVMPLIWDYEMEAFVFCTNKDDPDYHIAATSDSYLTFHDWGDVFCHTKKYCKNK